MSQSNTNTLLARRPLVLGVAKALFVAVAQLPLVQAAPFYADSWLHAKDAVDLRLADDPSLWLYLGVAAALVLLGGAFAGLTIALMGQDEIYLQVIRTSGEPAEKKHAAKVLGLLERGKHWVLVTLLLGNVITNETLPIVLDRSLGGGWPAVLGSTVLIVIFGEIAPQSVCVRYGLPIGSWMAPFVLALMYLLAPVAWPTAKLLDWILGEDHGTVYKKAGLKTLVSLHKTLGETGQQLNSDEVTIISAVLDLKDKPVGNIMTRMDHVFTLSADDVLDEETMDMLLTQGYSRIPVHHPDNDENFVGMLLVKMLITYDPEDAKPVRDFALATLPETAPETSCLDIINFFQEGKSHMVLVSDHPGKDYGAIGVVTLEDVIEELIGEEIVDESDVFIDVQKAIRRSMTPAISKAKPPKHHVVESESEMTNGTESELIDIAENETLSPEDLQKPKAVDFTGLKHQAPEQVLPSGAKHPSLARRRSSGTGSFGMEPKAVKRAGTAEMRERLKSIGPSNLASRPKTTRLNTIKIKPGASKETSPKRGTTDKRPRPRRVSEPVASFSGRIGQGLVTSGGIDASDAVQTLQYGSSGNTPIKNRSSSSPSKNANGDSAEHDSTTEVRETSRGRNRTSASHHSNTSKSHSTVGSIRITTDGAGSPQLVTKSVARSGSITENIINANGIRKVVLETTSSSSNEEDGMEEKGKAGSSPVASSDGDGVNGDANDADEDGNSGTEKTKKRRRRRQGHSKGEQEPLLGADR